MSSIAATAAARLRPEIIALQVLVGAFLLLRLLLQINGDLLGDEAYYFLWGQRPDWSYFDHPGLHGWLLGALSLVFGWTTTTIRILTWVTLSGTLWIFWKWAKRLSPDDPVLWFWRTAAIYLATPLFFALGSVAYHDHLLVFLCLLALHLFLEFVEREETGQRAAGLPWLYGAALALGLAALTKYSGAFVGFGFALSFLLRPRLRAMLAGPHPWLAGLLAVATQLPTILWNIGRDGASFRFHLDERWGGFDLTPNWGQPLSFVALTIIALSPFLVVPMVRAVFARPRTDFEDRARTLVGSTFIVSSLVMLTLSVVLEAYFYWNIVAYIGLVPLLVRFMGAAWLRWLHYAYGLLLAALLVVNFSVVPIWSLRGMTDYGSAINFGWSEIGDHMRAQQALYPDDLVGAPRYSTTSQLGFELKTLDAVRYVARERSHYAFWQAGDALAGRNGLILIDDHNADKLLKELEPHFPVLTELDRFTISRLGHPLYTWRIYRGEGYRP